MDCVSVFHLTVTMRMHARRTVVSRIRVAVHETAFFLCDDDDFCTDDICVPEDGTCSHVVSNEFPAMTNKNCTTDDTCLAGLCSGSLLICEDNLECADVGCFEDRLYPRSPQTVPPVMTAMHARRTIPVSITNASRARGWIAMTGIPAPWMGATALRAAPTS